jgi:WXXGXW repeat (2 copies)
LFLHNSLSQARIHFFFHQRYSFLSIAPFASSFLPCNATIRALLGYTFLKAIAALIAWRLTAKRRLSKMKNLLRAALLSSMLLLFAHHATAQVAIGIQIGPPPPPRHYVVPVGPGPEYAWVDGYWYPVNGHYVWHKGYWTRPPGRAGSALAMMAAASTPATGTVHMVASNTTITGIMTTTAITIAGTTNYCRFALPGSRGRAGS